MAPKHADIVIVASPTAPLLTHILHASSHGDCNITLVTRPTHISFSTQKHSHQHGHEDGHQDNQRSVLTHTTSDFSSDSLHAVLSGHSTLLAVLTGGDMKLAPRLVECAASAGIKRFIPTEYGLDTANEAVRKLLPPQKSRWEVQGCLRQQDSLEWAALYGGVVLEEGLKGDGVLGIDLLWGSVSAFGGREVGGKREIFLTTYPDLARATMRLATLPSEEWKGVQSKGVYVSSFQTNLEEVIEAVQKVEGKDRIYDWYEAVAEMAKKEADERMRMGYFDGAVSLLTKIVVWGDEADAFGAWRDDAGKGNALLGLHDGASLEETLRTVVKAVVEGRDGHDCGC